MIKINARIELEFWVLVFVEGCTRRAPENPEKSPRSRDEKQKQTQRTYGAGSGNRTRPTVVGGERSHHCVIPASLSRHIYIMSSNEREIVRNDKYTRFNHVKMHWIISHLLWGIQDFYIFHALLNFCKSFCSYIAAQAQSSYFIGRNFLVCQISNRQIYKKSSTEQHLWLSNKDILWGPFLESPGNFSGP